MIPTSQLDITNENQEVSPFPAGDIKASINRRAQSITKTKTSVDGTPTQIPAFELTKHLKSLMWLRPNRLGEDPLQESTLFFF